MMITSIFRAVIALELPRNCPVTALELQNPNTALRIWLTQAMASWLTFHRQISMRFHRLLNRMKRLFSSLTQLLEMTLISFEFHVSISYAFFPFQLVCPTSWRSENHLFEKKKKMIYLGREEGEEEEEGVGGRIERCEMTCYQPEDINKRLVIGRCTPSRISSFTSPSSSSQCD